ncbi:MAG: AAA family ATPase [Alphaproteobacteria bacterium]|nr:AAA family ATPase [Alphaproteobacteria bacterium]
MSKILYIIAGPNGSGKTTLAHELIKEEPVIFLNADEIAKRRNDTVGILSGRILLERLEKCFQNNDSIVLESTISGNYHKRIISRAKKEKYKIVFIYVFLLSVQQNLARIKQRVLLGGHNVPVPDVHRRYGRSLANFWDVIPMVSYWELYYNGEDSYEVIARGSDEKLEILNDDVYNRFKKEAK